MEEELMENNGCLADFRFYKRICFNYYLKILEVKHFEFVFSFFFLQSKII